MITAQPAHRVPAPMVHGNSMLPKMRAVLDRGLHAEWTSKDLVELLGISERGAQYLMNGPHLKGYTHPTRESDVAVRRASGLSVLLYILKHSDEITEADVLPVMKKMLPLLTDQILEGVMGACRAIISKRSGLLVAVKGDAPAAAAKPQAKPEQPDLFSALPVARPDTDSTPCPKTHP